MQYCQKNKTKQKHLEVPIQKCKRGNKQINQPKISEVKGRGLSPELVTWNCFSGKFSELERMEPMSFICCCFSFTGVLNISVSPDKGKYWKHGLHHPIPHTGQVRWQKSIQILGMYHLIKIRTLFKCSFKNEGAMRRQIYPVSLTLSYEKGNQVI